eukprot:scaffold43568_cov47-Phaeocystis_antarctica.AAC.1
MWSDARSAVSEAAAIRLSASVAVEVPTCFAGAPAHTCPAGTTVPAGSTAPAASIAFLPIELPLPTVQPSPTEHSSARVEKLTMLPAPMVTLSPTVLPTTDAFSPTEESFPRLTGFVSPFSSAPYQAEAPWPSCTLPMRLALGATKLASPMSGAFPSTLTTVVGIGSFSM